jgi:hypothetical protein
MLRFWIRFQHQPYSIFNLGCGVTAYDVTDAMKIVDEMVISKNPDLAVLDWLENIDVSALEDKHVRQNMGNPAMRGVWFPYDYE